MVKKYCSWDIADMERAIGAIRRGDMGLNQAAGRYEYQRLPCPAMKRIKIKLQMKMLNFMVECLALVVI